jgi:hypothetical protein
VRLRVRSLRQGQQLKCLTITDESAKEGMAIDVGGRIRPARVIEVLSRLVSARGAPTLPGKPSRKASTATSATNASASNGSIARRGKGDHGSVAAGTTTTCGRTRASDISHPTSSWFKEQDQRPARQRAGTLRTWGLRTPARSAPVS